MSKLAKTEVGYWIGKEFWGKGIASQALSQFLEIIEIHPLFPRGKGNLALLRGLDKCGFKKTGDDQGFANARGKVVEEFVLSLREDISYRKVWKCYDDGV